MPVSTFVGLVRHRTARAPTVVAAVDVHHSGTRGSTNITALPVGAVTLPPALAIMVLNALMVPLTMHCWLSGCSVTTTS